MSVSAVICELNPLHNGHLHVINKAKEQASAAVILVMSGNFSQRAGACAFHKYARARAAVEAGADLCVELPFPYSSSGAEYFARAGVLIAEAMGADKLVFGSECGDIATLRNIASALASSEYSELFENLSAADPSAGAAVIRERVLSRLIPDYNGGNTPNDVLAAEYIRNAKIPCIPVKRITTPSASALRGMATNDIFPHVPPSAEKMIKTTPRADDALFRDILWKYLRLSPEDFSHIAECGGGLGSRLKRLAGEYTRVEDFFEALKTKRYTNSRLLRAALFAFFGVSDGDISSPPPYTTLLAANERGCKLLSAMRKSPQIPIITKPADFHRLPESARRIHDLNRRADELYALLIGEKRGYFLEQSPFILHE